MRTPLPALLGAAFPVLAVLSSPLPCGCGSSSAGSTPPPCKSSGRGISLTPQSKETDIAAAFAGVQDKDTICLSAGTYEFTNELALGMANDVTVTGAGIGQTILDFHGQQAGEDSIFAQTVQNLTIEGLTVQQTPGNAIKVLDVTGMTFKSLEVKWMALDATDGAYGLYPVQCKNVLVEGCKISGASDSGIYIGQSQYVVVRNNEAFSNVAGIEIENSFYADVHDNSSHDNTGGILVFDLPGLQQEGGHNVRVYSNQIVNNNTRNFAVSGDIVGLIPAGTGFFVMANHDVEVFGNTITGNRTAAAGVISYALAQMPANDPKYYEWPKRVHLHDNTYSGNGKLPDATNKIGLLLGTLGKAVADVMYDGITDPAAGTGANPMTICVQEPKADQVCDMHFDKLNASDTNLAQIIDCNAAPYDCSLPALPAVTWAGMPQ